MKREMGSLCNKSVFSSSHSFGFECQRRSNLHLLDDNTLMFIAGNVIQIVNMNTHEQKYVRSTTGGGIGAIAVREIQIQQAKTSSTSRPKGSSELPVLRRRRERRKSSNRHLSLSESQSLSRARIRYPIGLLSFVV